MARWAGGTVSLLAIFFLAASLCAQERASSAAATPSEVLADVGGTSISAAAFRDEMLRRGGRFDTPDKRAALLEELVRAEAVHAAALRAGYDKRPEIVRDVRLLIIGRYLDENLAPLLAGLTVGEEELASYHAEHGQELASPRLVRGAVIWIEVPAKASEEKRAELRARAEAARAEALALPPSQLSFGSVAVTYSSDQATRYRGGDMGLVRPDNPGERWDAAVLGALFALARPGEVSPVVTAPGGYAIVKLAEVREAKVPPLAEVRDQIRHRILQQKRRTAEEEFFTALRARLKISVDRELLERTTPESNGAGAPPALPGNE